MTVEVYKGFGIDEDIYGLGEFSVQFCGDDYMFDTIDAARKFIDEIAA